MFPTIEITGLQMNKETLLRCKVADQIGLLDSAESKLLKLLTQGNWPKKK